MSENKKPVLLREETNNKKDRWSRHGLGHLLNPTDPEASDRNWTCAVWNAILRKAVGLSAKQPIFANLPAIGRTTVGSPSLMKCFESLNAGKPYAEQIKPFNFLQTCQLSPFGHPDGVDPEKCHLISAYDPDPRKWLEKEWVDQYTGKRFRITARGFADSQMLKWNDYKDVLSASYSEKYFDENRDKLLAAFERVLRRQVHFLTWYYAATACWALLCGLIGWQYGNIREWKIAYPIEKFMIPAISEWHAMFTPFTFPHSPERWVQVDALSSDGILYQGAAGIFHVGGDGKLTGFFLKNTKRFLRTEYLEAKKLDSGVSRERYWRMIPGETFYLPGDKISNLNFTYVAKQPLDTLAKDNLKKMNIDANVVIQPATATVQIKEPLKTQPAQDVQPREPQQTKTETDFYNFRVCKHCVLNRMSGLLPRITQDTPVISRSDGRSYHIYLQYGPTPQSTATGVSMAGVYLAHFRYDLDSKNRRNESVIVVVSAGNESYDRVVQIVEMVADKLALMLRDGKLPAKFYGWSAGNLSELPAKKGPIKRGK